MEEEKWYCVMRRDGLLLESYKNGKAKWTRATKEASQIKDLDMTRFFAKKTGGRVVLMRVIIEEVEDDEFSE